MAGIFISYRRSASKHLARLIFNELRQRGHDVFLDVTTIDSGTFDRIILNQIAARPHFLLILSPGSLERCANEGDWLRREIEEAFRLQRNIVPIFDEGFNIDHEKQYLPAAIQSELPRLNAPPYSHYYFDSFIDTIANRFLKTPTYEVKVIETPAAELIEVQQRIEQAAGIAPKPASIRSKVYDLLPAPFEWIEIPAGKVNIMKKTETLPTFQIGKYPVTNAQYAKFIEAGGYQQPKWWTPLGWQEKTGSEWIEPHYWQDKIWNVADYPVVGVSWYEAVAFCLWLSAVSSEKIMIPSEPQWQRAAQGDDRRIFAWGNDWVGSRCHNSVSPFTSTSTTSVLQYEGKDKGNSFFDVVNMTGNISEWCTTDYDTKLNNINSPSRYRVQRGGSWRDNSAEVFRVDFRMRYQLDARFNDVGFRIVRS